MPRLLQEALRFDRTGQEIQPHAEGESREGASARGTSRVWAGLFYRSGPAHIRMRVERPCFWSKILAFGGKFFKSFA
jgi:hypothetical protein